MNQRANGEGSIYRRADGRWTAACYVLRPDGSRVRRSVYGKTRKDVADQLAVLIAKTKAGLPLAVESWTVERFAEHWLKHVVGPRLRSLNTLELPRDAASACHSDARPYQPSRANSHPRANAACQKSCRWTWRALGPDHPQHPAHNAQRGHAGGVDRTECRGSGASATGRAR